MKCYCVVDFRAPLQEMDQPTPVPQGAQVLLKVRAAGVCHSDIHLWEGGYDLGQGRTLSLRAAARDAGLRPGGNYLVYPWIGCGNCPSCQAGQENHLHGPGLPGRAPRRRLRRPRARAAPRYLIDIGDLDPAQIAPYACSGLTTYAALKKIGEQTYRQHPVVIFGAGGLGLMCLTLIKALGGAGAIVVDIDPAKRQAALEAGAGGHRRRGPGRGAADHQAAGGKPAQAAIDLVGAPPPLRWPSTS